MYGVAPYGILPYGTVSNYAEITYPIHGAIKSRKTASTMGYSFCVKNNPIECRRQASQIYTTKNVNLQHNMRKVSSNNGYLYATKQVKEG